MRAYLGTRDGVYLLDGGGLAPLGLEGMRFWAMLAWPANTGADVVLAGSYGGGVFRSEDSGVTWTPANEGLDEPSLRCLQIDPLEPGAILAGTEPARVYRSRDGGRRWAELDSIQEIAACPDWYLPYSPRAGAVRNFYSPSGGLRVLFASVEVGGLLRSADGGEHWDLIGVDPGPRIHDDIHEITGDLANPDVLYVALGGALIDRGHMQKPDEPRRIGGVARSDDGGSTWRKILPDYTRSVIVPPSNPELLLAGPAERTDYGGRIVVSSDGGESWQPADHGIVTPMPDMVERFLPAPDGSIWAVCSAGRLFRAMPDAWHWREMAAGLVVDAVAWGS